jgi:S1-C subfamily serine protease
MAEKRAAHRIAVHLRACYRSSQTVIEGVVSDLSRLGMFLRTDFLDTPGQEVAIDLELPGEELLQLRGAVVRVETAPDHSGMGIRFDQIPDRARRPLANFMIDASYQSLQ